MTSNANIGSSQYLTKFGEKTISGNKYALSKLGIDRANCSLKIEEYIILCVPFQLGFKRSIFLASLSNKELAFFQKYTNSGAGLSISLNPNKRVEPVKFFLRCNLCTIGQMKGRENAGLFVVDFKATPDAMVSMLGNFLDTLQRLRLLYDEYGKNIIRMTSDVSKQMGFNMYATIAEGSGNPRRIQVFNMSSKFLEHMEAVGSPVLQPGTQVNYQLFFQSYRISVSGTVNGAAPMPQGIIRTIATLDFSPELVEILDDYWAAMSANANKKISLL